MSVPVTLVVEGTTDAAVVRRLVEEAGLEPADEYVLDGKDALDTRLAGYNSAARFSCWLVVRDLDRDAVCAPELRTKLLRSPASRMRFHIAVRTIEAWLMADAEAFAKALAVPRTRVPPDPEALTDPKREVVDLARRSRRREIREALVPPAGTSAKVGPGYAAHLAEFATEHWRPEVAATRSHSLARLRAHLHEAAQGGGAECRTLP